MFSPEQVTALTAQAASATAVDAFDAEGNLLPDWTLNSFGLPVYIGPEIATRGIGLYAQSPASLVTTGYLKPGTLDLITDPSLTLTVLNAPAVWTGLQGINSLFDYLDNPIVQNIVQIELMQAAYQGLIEAGVITSNDTPRFQATFLQPATQYGVDAVIDWIEGDASEELVEKIKIAARQGQYAIDFLNVYASALNAGVDLPGFENTVVRTDIDQAVTDIVGNSKIPAIEFGDAVEQLPTAKPVDEEGQLRFSPGSQKA